MGIGALLAMAWGRRAVLGPLLSHRRATFSQYGEDVVFDRLLHPRESGTYIDVGANHPVEGSNTFRLYTKGWSGLAIDPNSAFAALFRKVRPRDTFLPEGISRQPSTLEYFEFDNHLLNTFDRGVVEKMDGYGVRPAGTRQVPCRPLGAVIDQYLPGRQIDLLNVDCEGLDLEVLESMEIEIHRPTTIIVEDFARYVTFRDSIYPLALEQFLRRNGYAPIAQMGFSGLYMAEDWPRLFEKSAAFSKDAIDGTGIPPGHTPLESVGVSDYRRIEAEWQGPK